MYTSAGYDATLRRDADQTEGKLSQACAESFAFLTQNRLCDNRQPADDYDIGATSTFRAPYPGGHPPNRQTETQAAFVKLDQMARMSAAVLATVCTSKPGPMLPVRVLSQPLTQPISHCTISSGQKAKLTTSRKV
jgi:hypothetical protein